MAVGPTWTKFDTDNQPIAHPVRSRRPCSPPFGHPVIVNGEIFVSDGTRVFGFDLHGEFTRKYTPVVNDSRPLDPICTLTAADGLLYVRLGPSVVRPPEPNPKVKPTPESTIACISTATAGKFLELWSIAPPEDEKAAGRVGGAPLVSGRRLWAVYAKFEGGRTVHVAACYDPADAGARPRPPRVDGRTVRQPACRSRAAIRNRQELLTLAGPDTSCSARTTVRSSRWTRSPAAGRGASATRVRKRRPPARAAIPAPAVAFGGRVYVAPADGERVYALDAETGRLVWESGPTEGARILGVSPGRFVVTVAGPVRGIRGLNLDTGSHRGGGWVQPANASIPLSYGQGLVTDDVIVWPSREGLFFLDARDGRPATGSPNPLRGPHGEKYFGNIAYADGVLVGRHAGGGAGLRRAVAEDRTPAGPAAARAVRPIDRSRRSASSRRVNRRRRRGALARVVASDLPAALRAWAAARHASTLAARHRTRPASGRTCGTRSAPPLLAEWVIAPTACRSRSTRCSNVNSAARRRRRSRPIVALPDRARLCAAPSPPNPDIDRTLKLPPAVCAAAADRRRRVPAEAPVRRRPRESSSRFHSTSARPTEHAPADLFTHAAELRNGFVAAGPLRGRACTAPPASRCGCSACPPPTRSRRRAPRRRSASGADANPQLRTSRRSSWPGRGCSRASASTT